MDLTYDAQGLITAVVQDRLTGQVRMVGWMNREALQRTVTTGRATFYSRSRQTLWEKGESSGHTLQVKGIYTDCDADTLLLLVDPVGPTCHTGAASCFFRKWTGEVWSDSASPATPLLDTLEGELSARRSSSGAESYTKSLLEAGPAKIGGKVREEAAEFASALELESDDRVASEGADVVYHLMVGLLQRSLSIRDVLAKLAARAGLSGHAEKASRQA